MSGVSLKFEGGFEIEHPKEVSIGTKVGGYLLLAAAVAAVALGVLSCLSGNLGGIAMIAGGLVLGGFAYDTLKIAKNLDQINRGSGDGTKEKATNGARKAVNAFFRAANQFVGGTDRDAPQISHSKESLFKGTLLKPLYKACI